MRSEKRLVHYRATLRSMKFQQSLEGKIALLACLSAAAAALAAALLTRILDSWIAGLCAGLAVAFLVTVYAVRRFMRPINRLITALVDGVASFQDGDFSISLNAARQDELGELARHYNAAGEIMRRERHGLYQR